MSASSSSLRMNYIWLHNTHVQLLFLSFFSFFPLQISCHGIIHSLKLHVRVNVERDKGPPLYRLIKRVTGIDVPVYGRVINIMNEVPVLKSFTLATENDSNDPEVHNRNTVCSPFSLFSFIIYLLGLNINWLIERHKKAKEISEHMSYTLLQNYMYACEYLLLFKYMYMYIIILYINLKVI